MPYLKPEQLIAKSEKSALEKIHKRIVVRQVDAYITEDEQDAHDAAIAEGKPGLIPADPVGVEVVFRAPRGNEYDLFKQQANEDGPQQLAAQRTLALLTIVRVSGSTDGMSPRDALTGLLDEYPGLADACAKSIGELAAIGAAKRAKK